MKPVQFTINEELLSQLDADPQVQRDGRSAVMRRAIAAYPRERRARTIAAAYRGAYVQGGEGLGPEFAAWEDQGQWPQE